MTELELLKFIATHAKASHEWMLKSMKYKADELDDGNYTTELKHAMSVQELLDSVADSEEAEEIAGMINRIQNEEVE